MGFGKQEVVSITPPDFTTAVFKVIGLSPLVIHKFSHKMRKAMKEKQEAGSTAKASKKREKRDFDQDYKDSFHLSEEGWAGVPAAAFRNAMVTACKIVGFVMTRAKLAIFIESEGIDADEGVGLIRIIGEPEKLEMITRVETGQPTITVRPIWRKWEMNVRVTFDAGMLTLSDITNLLSRAGVQVGVGEGRPGSPDSCGMGWGTFRVENSKEKKNAGK